MNKRIKKLIIILKPSNTILKNRNVTPRIMNEVDVRSCDVCVRYKMACHSFKLTSGYCAISVGELIHWDVCSFEVQYLLVKHSNSFFAFIDNHSKSTIFYPMKCKRNIFSCFKAFCADFDLRLSACIKIFRTHNGGEYISKD